MPEEPKLPSPHENSESISFRREFESLLKRAEELAKRIENNALPEDVMLAVNLAQEVDTLEEAYIDFSKPSSAANPETQAAWKKLIESVGRLLKIPAVETYLQNRR